MKKTITFYLHTGESIVIDLIKPPKHLDLLIQKAFASYTEGTHPDYIDTDKLGFVDLIRERIYGQDFDAFYTETAHEMLDYELENGGNFDLEEFESSREFAETAYKEGFKPLRFRDEAVPHRDVDKCYHTLCRIIAAVMNYSAKAEYGEWIDGAVGDMPVQVCSKCNTFFPLAYTGGGHRYCPNCGKPMKIQQHVSNELDSQWVLTDPDCPQYRRLAPEKGEGVYELMQVNQYGDELFRIAHGFIYPSDVEAERENLIRAYGWDEDTIQSDEFPALLAEAAFEMGGTEYDTNKEFTSFADARAAMMPYLQKDIT